MPKKRRTFLEAAAAASPAAGETLRRFDLGGVMLVTKDPRALEPSSLFYQGPPTKVFHCRYKDDRPYLRNYYTTVDAPQAERGFRFEKRCIELTRGFACEGNIYKTEHSLCVQFPSFEDLRNGLKLGDHKIGCHADSLKALDNMSQLELRIRDFADVIFRFVADHIFQSVVVKKDWKEVFFVIDADPETGLMRNKDILYTLLEWLHILNKKQIPLKTWLIINNIDCLTSYVPKIRDSDCPRDLTIIGDGQHKTPATLRRALAEFLKDSGSVAYKYLDIACLVEKEGIPYLRALIKRSASGYPYSRCSLADIIYIIGGAEHQSCTINICPGPVEQRKAELQIILDRRVEARRKAAEEPHREVSEELRRKAEEILPGLLAKECGQLVEQQAQQQQFEEQAVEQPDQLIIILQKEQASLTARITKEKTTLEKIQKKLLEAIQPELGEPLKKIHAMVEQLKVEQGEDEKILTAELEKIRVKINPMMLADLHEKAKREIERFLDGLPIGREGIEDLIWQIVRKLRQKEAVLLVVLAFNILPALEKRDKEITDRIVSLQIALKEQRTQEEKERREAEFRRREEEWRSRYAEQRREEQRREEQRRRAEERPAPSASASGLTAAAAVTLFAAADPESPKFPSSEFAFFSEELKKYLREEFSLKKTLYDRACEAMKELVEQNEKLQDPTMFEQLKQNYKKGLHAEMQTNHNLNKPLRSVMQGSQSIIMGVPVYISALPPEMGVQQVFDLCELQQRPGFDTGKFKHDGRVYDVASIVPAQEYCKLLWDAMLHVMVGIVMQAILRPSQGKYKMM